MDILSNREWSTVIWSIALILIFCRKEEIRESILNLFKSLFAKPLLRIFILMFLYIIGSVYALHKIGVWEYSQLKNTVLWSLSTAAVSIVRINKISRDPEYFKNSVVDNLKALAILEFIVSVYSFSLPIELAIVPSLGFLGACLAVAESDEKYHNVTKAIKIFIMIIGLITLTHTGYMLFSDFKEIAQIKSIYDFFIPPILTITFIPFLYLVIIYVAYENAFLRLDIHIKSKKIRFLSKIYSVYKFHFRRELLDRWVNLVEMIPINRIGDIRSSSNQIYKMVLAEKSPTEVPINLGWSPYEAKDYLIEEGVITGYYKPFDEENWFACSQMLKLGDEIIPNNVAYYVDGDEVKATSLKIKLNINARESEQFSINRLIELGNILCKKSLGFDMPEEIKISMNSGIDKRIDKENKTIAVTKDNYLEEEKGYSIKFIISCEGQD